MAPKKRILLIEDEEDIAALIKLQADLSGYKLHVEVDGVNGYRAVEREKPDLVLVDVMLPGQNGFDVCRKIKNNSELKNIPVIILSAKSEELDMILGLELGADDYVSKPFSPKVLFSRIKAILRRGKEPEKAPKLLSFGDFTLDVSRYLLKKNGAPVTITLSEFGILKRLLIQQGKVLTRNQLLNDVHNDDVFIVDRNIDVHIASLRKKLGPNFNWIETVRGVGYRLREKPVPSHKT
ncbi:response regulator transcription factor [Candidatus Neptunichlamydia sp. REUL1]|uniref:response regulator transcription factor n=1 Tax=Candidatus Neptunichlamydia sp. REUL1 TaxID=3064277 RepID=UPI00292D2B8C|nr:response regulator transcription factor [Candidatus Neptunochlamydia sp. REUL1]